MRKGARKSHKLQTAKSPVRQYRAFHLFGAWQFPPLALGDPTLPLAHWSFTSEFGKGAGGASKLLSSAKGGRGMSYFKSKV